MKRRYDYVTQRWVQPVWDYRSWEARERRREAQVKQDSWGFAVVLIPIILFLAFKLPL